jgi:group I intron endonuclease
MIIGYIYQIKNIVNGKFYIGKTEKTIKYRFSNHMSAGKNPKDYFHNAVKKYGRENFKIEIIKYVYEDDDINELEKHYIGWLKPQYNLKEGGEGGRHNPQTIEKLKNWKKTEEHKKKLSEARMGVKPLITPERNEKISKKLKGRNNWSKGRKWWNNGEVSVLSFEQPDGFVKGRIEKHKSGLKKGLDVGYKMNLSDEEIQRRKTHMLEIRNEYWDNK